MRGLFQVDAFTHEPFTGNPAAVCLLDKPREESWMQSVAAQMNLAETAFVSRLAGRFQLRWFTPTTEVPLCGHATLASAHVLWQEQVLASDDDVEFETQSGLLRARSCGEWIRLDFPSAAVETNAELAENLDGLGVSLQRASRSDLYYLAELGSEQAVRDVKPDLQRLSELDRKGVIVTSRVTGPPYDFVSRFFAPALGIDEDPVTGSAHCVLGPYWASRLGKPEVVGYQASARGGVVRVRVEGAGVAPGRVHLCGQAVTVWQGALVGAARGDEGTLSGAVGARIQSRREP